jgi:myo-inositol-1(or 4)-monophosphatase
MPDPAIKQCLLECVGSAGELLRRHFGKVRNVARKDSAASVVCEADLAAEKCIVEQIVRRFPEHGIIAEETGCKAGSSPFVWVIDPLDGTSNFVAGIPWFGVQVGVLRHSVPMIAAIYLPVDDVLYFSEAGHGVWRNGQPVRVTSERSLDNVLCALGLDGGADVAGNRRNSALHSRLAAAVRNIRATNSVIDFCFTLDGRLGGFINTSTRVWDIVPVALMLPEAGGRLSDLEGDAIVFRPESEICTRTYQVVGASDVLHPALLDVTRFSRPAIAIHETLK